MPQNSLPDHIFQFQTRQRQYLERLLSYLRQQAEGFEIDLTRLDPASDEFLSKRQWCDGWGAMGRGLEGILASADKLSETDPTSAGHLLHHAVTVTNGMVAADNYTQAAHANTIREMIPALQAEVRAKHTEAAREARTEDQRKRVETRRQFVTSLVNSLSSDRRPTGPDKLASCIAMDLRKVLADAGLADDIPHSVSTIRKDIVDLGLA